MNPDDEGRERIARLLPPTQFMGWLGSGDDQTLYLYGPRGNMTTCYTGSCEEIEAKLKERLVLA